MTILVGKEVPDLTAAAVLPNNEIDNNFNICNYIEGKFGVIFFYPLDFTFVCPSEIIALDHKIEEFQKRGAAIMTVSIDSQFTHLAYKRTPVEQGGIGNVRFPMVADVNKNITSSFGILHNQSVALRGVFITDRHGIVRHQLVNDLPIGRNIDEILRTIDAIAYHEENGEVCPANWQAGKKAIKPNQEGISAYLRENAGSL